MKQKVYLIGLNHRTADVEIRERFALTEFRNSDGFSMPQIPIGGSIAEAVTLFTCNRVEIYAVGPGPETRQQVLVQWATTCDCSPNELEPYIYTYEGLRAVRHLFGVAASLDSMVIGEPQILGQLKQAYRLAANFHYTGVILNRLMHKSFSVAKRVRTETDIGLNAVSISYAAVELAKRIFGDTNRYTAMLIGAGEMAELAAQHLLTAGIHKIMIANRTLVHAKQLAKRLGGEAINFKELFHKLMDADIIISSTGAPQTIIHTQDIKDIIRKRRNRPMFFIDIAVPRDIDPDINNLDNVYLYDIDDLKEVIEENLVQRREEATKAESIVRLETKAFGRWLQSLELQPTIVDLLERSRAIGSRELAKTLKHLGPNTSTKTVAALEKLVDSLVGKFNHDPIVFLKRHYDEEQSVQYNIDLTRMLFNLDGERHSMKKNSTEKLKADNILCIPS
ncbi:Glutamyl-tRNA reductase [Desulfovibrionales bacterium]